MSKMKIPHVTDMKRLTLESESAKDNLIASIIKAMKDCAEQGVYMFQFKATGNANMDKLYS